ncbi:hypothetical protein JCM19037_2301 [Geomicrobium sp. JCM 19037]|nr:hypothetical protein JCM19037_2301 [Geomicrobium sp. JCM 19037]
MQQELPRANDLVELVSFALETIMANNTMRKKNMLIGAAMPTSEAEFLHAATTFNITKLKRGGCSRKKSATDLGVTSMNIYKYLSLNQPIR